MTKLWAKKKNRYDAVFIAFWAQEQFSKFGLEGGDRTQSEVEKCGSGRKEVRFFGLRPDDIPSWLANARKKKHIFSFN